MGLSEFLKICGGLNMSAIKDKKWYLTEVKGLSEKQADKEIKKWLKGNFKKIPNFDEVYQSLK